MQVSRYILVLTVVFFGQTGSAHQDRVITIDRDGSLVGLPVEYGSAKLQVSFATASNQAGWTPPISSVVLSLGKNRTQLPECLTRVLNSKSLNDIAISASWYHSEERLPYYLNVMFLDPGYTVRDEAPGFRLLFNLRTAKLMRLEVMLLEHGGTIGRDLPLDVGELCEGSGDLAEIVDGMWPNYAMQRSSRVVTPLAGTASGTQRLWPASGAPTARRR